ncbi:SET domain-containing protein 9 isoform X3 [Phyllobates terribilis]|uniref:SET domain-containing protein 9 isoform X3 n=1 Tax=Phyllobates terribilis TaxID=111132 RepID=UPI003CCB0AA5
MPAVSSTDPITRFTPRTPSTSVWGSASIGGPALWRLQEPECLSPKGAVYQNYEPIFFQSIGNPFIFRCLDGILIDGSDKRISKSVYRSCSRRDQLGPLKMCDCTWLTSAPHNPLAVGQYVNNCSNVHEANVCYQEFDVPASFPVELRQYIPNVRYSHDVEGPLRCVVLVALRDIRCGEELFSNYFTLIQ